MFAIRWVNTLIISLQCILFTFLLVLVILGLFCLFQWPTLDRGEIPVKILWFLNRILSSQTCSLAFWIITSRTLTWLQSGSLRQLIPFTSRTIPLRISPLHRNHNSAFLFKQRWPFCTFKTFITLPFRIPFQISWCLNLRRNGSI